LGCELHQNAFGGQAPPIPAGEAIVLPQTVIREGGRGRGRKGSGIRREGKVVSERRE